MLPDDIQLLAFLDHIGRMLDALRPGEVGNVDQTVDAWLDLDKYTEVGDVADLATHDRSGGIALGDVLPRIGLELFHAQGYLLPFRIDVQDLHVDHLAK